jgi:hypothetical protein
MPGAGRLQQAAAASAVKKQVDLDVQAYQKARNTFVNAIKVRYVAFSALKASDGQCVSNLDPQASITMCKLSELRWTFTQAGAARAGGGMSFSAAADVCRGAYGAMLQRAVGV